MQKQWKYMKKIDGKYVYNAEITEEINKIKK